MSDFEQAALITAASRIYPILHDDEAEASRDRFLDAMLFHSGVQPIGFAPLAPNEKRRAMDALAQLVTRAVEREEVSVLESGVLRLQGLGVENEVAALVSAVLGRPLELERSSKTLLSAG